MNKATKTINGGRKCWLNVSSSREADVAITKQGTKCSVRIAVDGDYLATKDGPSLDRFVRRCIKAAEKEVAYGFGGKTLQGFKDSPSAHYNTRETKWTFDVRVRRYGNVEDNGGFRKLTGTPVTDLHEANRLAVSKRHQTKASVRVSARRLALKKAKSLLTKKELRLLGLIK